MSIRSIGHLADGRKAYIYPLNGREYMAVTDIPAVADYLTDFRECRLEITLPDANNELTTGSVVHEYMVKFECDDRDIHTLHVRFGRFYPCPVPPEVPTFTVTLHRGNLTHRVITHAVRSIVTPTR